MYVCSERGRIAAACCNVLFRLHLTLFPRRVSLTMENVVADKSFPSFLPSFTLAYL